MNKILGNRVNSPLSWWGPKFGEDTHSRMLRVYPMDLPEFPTCDTYRVRVDSEEYTMDNEGS